MIKIMLVEDDKSLREIYGVRLLAEGYEIVSAGDGEEALAMAVKEHPDLIISDVMMPKISGFDMLDILRSTPETKNIKVIMMTALSSEDQRARGESLGANRYLVKSQVGIEDVVRTVHEVLADTPAGVAAAASKISNQPIAAPAADASTQPFYVPTNSPTVNVTVYPTTVGQSSASDIAAPAVKIPTAPVVSTIPQMPPQNIEITNPIPVLNNMPAQPTSAPGMTSLTSPVVIVPAQPINIPIQAIPAQPAPQLPIKPAISPVETTPIQTAQMAPTAPTPSSPQPSIQLPQPTAPFSTPIPASMRNNIIEPITAPTPTPDFASLMSREISGDAATTQGQPIPPTV